MNYKIIKNEFQIENGFTSSLSLKTILNGDYRFVPDTAKLFTKEQFKSFSSSKLAIHGRLNRLDSRPGPCQ